CRQARWRRTRSGTPSPLPHSPVAIAYRYVSEPCLCLGQLTDLDLTRTGKPVKPPRADSTPEPAEARPLPSRIPWAELLLRVFREDVLSCPCGGWRTVLVSPAARAAPLPHPRSV